MNERIKELAEQAELYALDKQNEGDDEDYECSFDDDFREKFAELLINECIGLVDVMEKIANSANASIPRDYDKHTYLETLGTVRGLIETHFGVEE